MATRYRLDPRSSRFTVQAFASGMLSAFAHNPIIAIRDFGGELVLGGDGLAGGSFTLTVHATSLEVSDSIRQKDRLEIDRIMRTEVLEIPTYPDIRFQSNEIAGDTVAENWYRATFKGSLQLHGVTRPLEIDAQVTVMEDSVRVGGGFSIRQTDFRMKRISAAGGMIVAKDEIKFTFDIVGKKETT
jgi:polyisoprenoid-binding protein YceI